MAITQGQPRATKVNILTRGCPTTDVYKMALYTNTSTLAPTSATVYNTTGDVSGTGYTAGGITLSGATITQTTTGAALTFSDAVFVNVTLTGVTGCAIYNTSKSNEIVGLYSFASESPVARNMTIDIPPAGDTAVVRID